MLVKKLFTTTYKLNFKFVRQENKWVYIKITKNKKILLNMRTTKRFYKQIGVHLKI